MKTNLLEPSEFRLEPSEFRVEFPAEVLVERKRVTDQILRLMTKNALPAIREACRMHNAWLDRYPDDYVMLDLGGALWMLADAIEATTETATLDEQALSMSRQVTERQ